MKEHDGFQPSPETDCGFAKNALQGLWVDGCLNKIEPGGVAENRGNHDDPASRQSDDGTTGESPSLPSRFERSSPPGDGSRDGGAAGGGRVDTAILRHIDGCPSCRQEADELDRLGQSLRVGLESLCGAIAETMDKDIEGTLQKIREESANAKFLRRIRRPLRLVLWISFLAFTLLASVTLAVAVYEALKGL